MPQSQLLEAPHAPGSGPVAPPDPPGEWSAFFTLLVARLRILKNTALDARRDALAKTVVVVLGLLLVVAIGFCVSFFSLRFIENFPAIGSQLNSRLLSLLFMVLFTMVVISCAIVTYTSLFVADETHFFFQNPLPPSSIFFFKAAESGFLSGWATFLLCCPVLVAFGVIRGAGWWYYVEALTILVLFIFFCSAAGTVATVLLLTVVRRWTLRKLAILSTALLAAVAWVFLRSFDFASFNGEDNLLALNRFTMNLTALRSPYFPSSWATSGLLAACGGHHREALFQMGLLLANSLITIPVLHWYAQRFFGDKWVRTIEPGTFSSAGRARGRPLGAPATRSGRPTAGFSGPMQALHHKDFLTFLRAPAQISQFVLFLILTAVYVLSLTQIPSGAFSSGWKLVLFFSNVAAVCLILSSFTSRFLFPLISLEGRAFWIVGLAPVDRSFLLMQKVRFGRYVILLLGGAAAVCSCWSLRLEFDFLGRSLFLVVLSGWVLTSLAVGLGAAYPNLTEDNPARMAVGLGGTLNFFASALAVIALIFIEAAPYLIARSSQGPPPLWTGLSHVGALLFTFAVSRSVLRVGERALERMDF